MQFKSLRYAGFVALLLWATLSQAATITVNDLGDAQFPTAGDGKCTAREAVYNANAGLDVSGGDCAAGTGNDIIILPAGTITMAWPLTATVALTISGQGADATIFDGASKYGIVGTAASGNYLFSDFQMDHSGPSSAGIFNQADIVVNASTCTMTVQRYKSKNAGNRGVWGRAGVYLTVLDSDFDSFGNGSAGIFGQGDLVVKRCSVENGLAIGIVHNGSGNALVENSTFYNNQNGGIQNAFGTMDINFCTSVLNYAPGASTAGYGFGTVNSGPIINLSNSIAYGNFRDLDTFNAGGVINSLGHNIYFSGVSSGAGTFNTVGTGDITSSDPLLLTITTQVGQIPMYIPMSAGSPALDSAADLSYTVTQDVINTARPQNGVSDRGSYELAVAAAPTVSGLSFNSAFTGGTTGLVITGTGFLSPLTVTVKGANSASFSIDSATQITANVPANTAGSGNVIVTSSTGSSSASGSTAFTYVAVPSVSSLSFNSAPIAGTTGLVITGTGFASPLTVTVKGNNSASFSIDSATQITANVPANTAGSGNVVVTNGSGSSSTGAGNAFSYLAVPTLSNLSFNSAAISGTAGLVITGTGFVSPLTVTVKGVDSTSFVINSATQITALVPANTSGSGDVVVTNGGGASSTGASSAFTYAAAPSLSGISFSSGSITGTAGLVISGADFYAPLTVTVNGVDSASFVLNSSGQITADVPANSVGNGDVLITTVNGVSTANAFSGYLYIDNIPPVINASVSPASGSTLNTGVPLIHASYSDLGSGIDVPALMIDGVTVSAGVNATLTDLDGTLAVPLAVGVHNVVLFVPDDAGNLSSKSWSFSTTVSEARYEVGAGKDFASIGSALAAVKDAETALGGGAASFNYPRYIQIGAGNYAESNDVSVANVGGSPTAANPLIIRHSGSTVHPSITGVGVTATFNVTAPYVTLDGLDIQNGSTPFAVLANGVAGFVLERSFLNTTQAGVWIVGGSSQPKVMGNAIYSNTSGFILANFATDGLQFTNNTMRSDAANILVVIGATSGADITVSANIFADPNGNVSAGNFFQTSNANSVPEFADRNIYDSGVGSGFSFITDQGTGRTLANWKSTHSGLDVNSIEADPLLVGGAGAAGLGTQSGSPAIEFANGNTYGLDTDYFGKSRYPDAGFSEYVISTAVKPILLSPYPAAGVTNTAAVLTLTAQIQDPGGSGINQGSLVVHLDGVELLRSTSANFVSAPTGTLATGLHSASIDVDDNAGNHANQLNWTFVVGAGLGLTYTADTTAPVISAASPQGVTTNALPVIYVSVTDTASGVSLTSVVLHLDGVVVPATVTANATAATITFTPATALSYGLHHVALDVADAAGNTANQYLWTFTVGGDSTAPVISSPLPTGSNPHDPSSLAISAALADAGSGIDVATAIMTLDGAYVTPTAVSASSISYSPVGLSNGVHQVTVNVKDVAGNAATALSWTFVVGIPDSIAPVASSPIPTDGGYGSTTGTVITANLSDAGGAGVDIASVVMTVDGAYVTPTALSAASISYSAPALSAGAHLVTVDLKDLAGNAATRLSWTFNAAVLYCASLPCAPDTTPPLADQPRPTGVSNTASPIVWARLSDTGGSGVDTTSIVGKIDGSVVAFSASATDVTLTASGLTDGVHTVSLDFKDVAGNSAPQLNWSFTVAPDTTPPVISAGSPTGITPSGNVLITAHLFDAGSGILTGTAQMSIDGNPVPYGSLSDDGITLSYTASVGDGVHTVTVDIKDAAGNSAAQAQWTFTGVSDTTPPVASNPSPAGSSLTGTVGVSLSADFSDNVAVNLASVSMTVDGVAVNAIVGVGTVSYSVPGTLSVGVHHVTVDLKDTSGNVASQLSWSFSTRTQYCDSGANTLAYASQFFPGTPFGASVARDSAGDLYVIDSTSNIVNKYTAAGAYLLSFPSWGAGNVMALAIDSADHVYSMTDAGSIFKTDVFGTGGVIATVDPNPAGIAVDGTGNVYVANNGSVVANDKVRKYDSSGTLLLSFGSAGSGNDQYSGMGGIAVDGSGDIYIADTATDRIEKIGPTGVFISQWNTVGSTPVGVAINPSGYVYAAVQSSNSIEIYDLNGAFQGQFGATGAGNGQFNAPTYMAFQGAQLLVADRSNGRLQILDPGIAICTTFDDTAPVIANASPAGGSVTNTASPLVTVSFSDLTPGSGVDSSSAVLLLDGVAQSFSASASFLTLTTATLSEGVHTVTVNVKDFEGHAATQLSWQFTVQTDTTAPLVQLNSPTDATPVTVKAGTSVSVSYYAYDLNLASVDVFAGTPGSLSSAVHVNVTALGNPVGGLSGTAQIQVPAGMTSGYLGVSITATDTKGNSSSAYFLQPILVDADFPTAANAVPLPGDTLVDANGNTEISAQLTDLGSGIDLSSVKLRLDGALKPAATATLSGTGVSVSFTATGLSPITHTVSVDYADAVGNTGATYTWSFYVVRDNTAPVVSVVTGPTPMTVAAGANINVSYSYTEANPAYVSITVMSGAALIGSKVISAGLLPDATRTDSVALLSSPTSGVYDILVAVYDTAGLAGSLTANASVVVDATAPTANATTQPILGATVTDATGTTDIAFYLGDTGGSDVDTGSVKLLLDGSFRSPLSVTPSDTGYSVSYTASGLSAGIHSATLSYADLVGNVGLPQTLTFTVVIDNQAPTVTAVSVNSLSVAAGTNISVNYSYLETNPAYVSITVMNGANIIGRTVISSGLLADSSRTDGVALLSTATTGVYDVLVTLVDQYGLAASLTANASVVVDATAPTVSASTQPALGATVIDVNGTTDIAFYLGDTGGADLDVSSVKLLLDGSFRTVSPVLSGGGYSVTYTASSLTPGIHSATISYADLVGNVGLSKTLTFTVVVDNTAPVIMSIVSPKSPTVAYTHASGTVDVNWSYLETNPQWVSITVRSGGTIVGQSVISSGLASADSTTAGVTMTTAVDLFDTVAAGLYDVQVTMQDAAGQQGSLTNANSVLVDNALPTATLISPTAASITQTASPNLWASLADTGLSGVSIGTVVMRLDGVIVPAAASATLVQYSATNLTDGVHTVDVDLQDNAGNQAQRLSWSFRTDVNIPQVALTAPVDGAFVRGTLPLAALSSDTGSGVTQTAFYYGGVTLIGTSYFNGTSWNDGTGVSPSASTRWDTTAVADGSYDLTARSADLVGNTATSSVRTVIVDNTAPVLTIDPVNSPTQYQDQTITGQLVEQNVASLLVNGVQATLSGAAPNFTWIAVVPLFNGANGVTITATDKTGLSDSRLVGITFDPTATVHFIAPVAPHIFMGQVEIEASAPTTARWMTFQVSADNQATWNSVSLNASVAGVYTTLTKSAANGWRLSWSTTADNLADGSQYYLRNAAYDELGVLLGTSVIGPFTVDNIAPLVSFSVLPAPALAGSLNEVYQDNISIQGSVTETGSGVARIHIEHLNSSGGHVNNSPVDLPVLPDNQFSRNITLIEGYNQIIATVYDLAGNASSFTYVIYYVRPQSSGTVCSSGDSVAAPDGTQIDIPANALIRCIDVSIITVIRSLLPSTGDGNLQIVGVGHKIEPVEEVFQVQSTVTLPYTDADLDPDADGTPNFDPLKLKVLFWDGTAWENVGVDTVDTTNRRIKVRTNHLGLFALAADVTTLPSSSKVFLTKNPFRYGVEDTSFVYDMPKPGKINIKIYDLTGDVARVLVQDLYQSQGRFTQVWDGLNNFNRFVGSGAYIFRFEAEYSDGSKTTVTKAIGVLK